MNKALFLDRDGVITEDIGYLHRIEDCIFCDGIFEEVKSYYDDGYLVIIVTNQAGIAKKRYTEQQYRTLRDWIHDQFMKHGIEITAEYYCPHHPDFTGLCGCRKPEPGMILKAAEDYDIDLEKSILIGNKETDIQAGKAAGIGKLILK